MVDAKEMKKILRANGYDFIRCKGSHFMYSNGKNTIAVNKAECSGTIEEYLRRC